MDPFGQRTIGVITKMDLVEPDVGKSILNVILALKRPKIIHYHWDM